jgi:iron complex transport system permease protein
LNRSLLTIAISSLLLFAVAFASLFIGPIWISVIDWNSGSIAGNLSDTERSILWELRLPRIITAVLVGGSLGVSGVGFQAMFRNPLADPYVIGASSGAALGVTLSFVLGVQLTFIGLGATALAAMLGSVLAVLVVLVIGSFDRDSSALSLLLAGVALSSMINAVVSLLMYLNEEKVVVILSWLMGSLADNDWSVVRVTCCLTALGLAVTWGLSRGMDVYSLGDVASQSLGLEPVRFRIWVVIGSSISTAAAVAAAGIVGFVGLIAPHVSRFLVGPRHVVRVPMSGITGAMILLVADGLARTLVAPAELPVGIITALLGGPFFLFLLKSRSGVGGMSL